MSTRVDRQSNYSDDDGPPGCENRVVRNMEAAWASGGGAARNGEPGSRFSSGRVLPLAWYLCCSFEHCVSCLRFPTKMLPEISVLHAQERSIFDRGGQDKISVREVGLT